MDPLDLLGDKVFEIKISKPPSTVKASIGSHLGSGSFGVVKTLNIVEGSLSSTPKEFVIKSQDKKQALICEVLVHAKMSNMFQSDTTKCHPSFLCMRGILAYGKALATLSELLLPLKKIIGDKLFFELIMVTYDETLGDKVYTIYEKIDGITLFDHIRHGRPTNFREIGRSLLRSVEIMHSMNVVHRDLKSENMMIDTEGNLKFIDFGEALLLEEPFTRCTGQTGTPTYMSPEVLHERFPTATYKNASVPVNLASLKARYKATDMFSVGAILYEMIYQIQIDEPLRKRGLADMGLMIWKVRAFVERRDPGEEHTLSYVEPDPATVKFFDIIKRLISFFPHLRPSAKKALEDWDEAIAKPPPVHAGSRSKPSRRSRRSRRNKTQSRSRVPS